jgi:hypothetical protein
MDVCFHFVIILKNSVAEFAPSVTYFVFRILEKGLIIPENKQFYKKSCDYDLTFFHTIKEFVIILGCFYLSG